MAVKLRLKRLGRKKSAFYRLVAIDSRKKRDGLEIERLGWFNPVGSKKAAIATHKQDGQGRYPK